jgi:hypothetical protein
MDDPTPPKTRVTEEDIFPGPDEWLADVRSWHAEQRAKYGMNWEPDESDRVAYCRSRGITVDD